jgi:uncharacterized protein (UPF0332 family)
MVASSFVFLILDLGIGVVMQWREFLDTAKRLAQGTTEGDWRFAVSRAYYAVFHFFRAFLARHGLPLGRGGQSHFNLSAGLTNCGVPEAATIANSLNDLRDFRTRSDYDFVARVFQPDAISYVQDAEAMVLDFQQLSQSVPPVQIVSGVRAFLQSAGRLGRNSIAE